MSYLDWRTIIAVFLLSAFTATPLHAGALELEGTEWILKGDPEPHPRSMKFDEDGKVSGHSGCNHYGGEYRYANGRLTLNALTMTEMACQEVAMQREAEFSAILGKIRGARLEGAELILLGEAGNALASLKRATGG